jgi:hypothetical protein
MSIAIGPNFQNREMSGNICVVFCEKFDQNFFARLGFETSPSEYPDGDYLEILSSVSV